MSVSYVTSKNKTIQLGRVIGTGGEGAVHEVNGYGDYVAKIYHKPLTQEKQKKLRLMVSKTNKDILKYTSWPISTLTDPKTQMIVGFIMQKVVNKKALHDVYSPAHRKQEHPELAWDYLLYVARNISASFESIHAQGYIIGDVNENSIMVGTDSQAAIIDTDSFQIIHAGEKFLCAVGVPNFTAPELQALSSFSNIERTTSHDNFALALLIFHVLLGARHPFAGQPLRDDVGNAMEEDIQHFRYAYAPDANKRGFAPPPRSIPITILPDHVQNMFVHAFTEQGAKQLRPTAKQWVDVLDDVIKRLSKCGQSKVHIYSNHLAKCPWCELDKDGLSFFVDTGGSAINAPNNFSLTQVWAKIQKISPPNLISTIPATHAVIAQPLPKNIKKDADNYGGWWLLIVSLLLLLGGEKILLWGLILGAIAVFWIKAGGGLSDEFKAEKKRRYDELESAKKHHDNLLSQMKSISTSNSFLTLITALDQLSADYKNLDTREQQELRQFRATAESRQKLQFLGTCYIDRAKIAGITPSLKSNLRSFGIETAADVSKHKVLQVRGFGDVRTRAMMDWRASCERRFTFNPAMAISAQDSYNMKMKFMNERTDIENRLSVAPKQLEKLKTKIEMEYKELNSQLIKAGQSLAQKKADYNLLL